MLQGVKHVKFNVFDRDMSLEWSTVVNQFREQNELAKNATRNLIDTSFRRLRSAEGAFELLENFKKIESKGAIKEQMASKLNDILEQFSREIDTVKDIFDSQRCVLTAQAFSCHLAMQAANNVDLSSSNTHVTHRRVCGALRAARGRVCKQTRHWHARCPTILTCR